MRDLRRIPASTAAERPRWPRTSCGDDRRRSSTAGLTTRASSPATAARSARAGSRSSTSRAATSRSRTRRGRVWAAQNGEIYNHDELRDELARRGHALRSRCDTEVLPHLYEEHGPALAEHLRGMFAVAVWDATARRGVLIRDRLGIKPLYYAIVDDVVVFGSELKCVHRQRPGERRARPGGDRRAT